MRQNNENYDNIDVVTIIMMMIIEERKIDVVIIIMMMIIEERKSEWSLWRVTISCPFTHTIIIISVITITTSKYQTWTTWTLSL